MSGSSDGPWRATVGEAALLAAAALLLAALVLAAALARPGYAEPPRPTAPAPDREHARLAPLLAASPAAGGTTARLAPPPSERGRVEPPVEAGEGSDVGRAPRAPLVAVRGRALRAGVPLEDRELRLVTLDGAGPRGSPWDLSGDDGEFDLHVPRGTYRLLVDGAPLAGLSIVGAEDRLEPLADGALRVREGSGP